MSRLHVCIDARSSGDTAGGSDTLILGLATGLSQLDDGDERFSFLVRPGLHDWIEPHLRASCVLLPISARDTAFGQSRPAIPVALRLGWLKMRQAFGGARRMMARSDGSAERAGAHVIHFPSQSAFLTRLPSIYHPHDLQHLHFPDFFPPLVRHLREREYRVFCAEASMVAVSSSWAKRDLIAHYGLSEEKVRVVPLAPGPYPVPGPELIADVRARFRLPEAFVLYPAQTWPHKNHLALVRALGELRRRGLTVPLVCSGRLTEYFEVIKQALEENALTDHVHFLGFIRPEELRALYALCRVVVIPSRFEAASFPLWEAFQAGAAAACSLVTSLPEQAGDAAVLFEPDDVGGLAQVVERLWLDPTLRAELVRRGRAKVQGFTWHQTAETFRVHYRRLAGRELTARDRELLTQPPSL